MGLGNIASDTILNKNIRRRNWHEQKVDGT
jgi:hypothetical protein